jgi:hypothetical protein
VLPPISRALEGPESLKGRAVGFAFLTALAVGFCAVVRVEGLLSAVALDMPLFPALEALGRVQNSLVGLVVIELGPLKQPLFTGLSSLA